ncbi:General transcription and DNA repair factor IIH helicase subunit XPB2 [Picochlorum sp. SENEW3]|nr:General transcription and DNA repair factor IIH helicase subunit XPB2 [Picochlorum sp. SENEW3]WPT17090.1 General transcription and DNA repair factor IIH helicase subunit XPB2 [Picochlorum sp. SENEW3]
MVNIKLKVGGQRRPRDDEDEDYDPLQEEDARDNDFVVDGDELEEEDDFDEEDLYDDDDDDIPQVKKTTKKKTVTRKTAQPSRGSRKNALRGATGVAALKSERKRTAAMIEDEDYDLEEDFDSDRDAEEGAYVLGAEDTEFHDFSQLDLKADHYNRPLWVCPDGRIFLETFSPVYKQAYDFLIAIAEPVSRPECIHEYVLTPHSLYAAVSIGLDTTTIISVLDRLSKAKMPSDIRWFIRESTENYGKVKLVLKNNRFMVESPDPHILRRLLKDDVIRDARMVRDEDRPVGGAKDADAVLDEFLKSKALKDRAVDRLAAVERIELTDRDDDGGQEKDLEEELGLDGDDEAAEVEDPDKEMHAFEVRASKVENVKSRCLPGGLNYPMLEEYDFKGDSNNPTLSVDLKPHVKHRSYQEKSLSKMFGNSRARSGIIVLPCGAGKSLVGVSAAARIKKSCLCLCTNSVSVDQWKYQFQLWTTLREDQVCRFTSDKHEWLKGEGAGVCITTYTMVAYSGKRSVESERIMDEIMSREWGLILLDEVHVVPAQMFRKVLGIVKAHCKLGLTATLVREDQLITDLNFLIGPKLYEANWLDLTKNGHIANVQCAEVWCPMTPEFLREYLKPERTASQKQLLFVMNPNKARACDYLVRYHEARGDKIIVFSDNLFALREYAVRMKKPFLYGGTGHQERTRILHAFKTNPAVNTIFLSKVGDNSLDIPEANVLIQVSSHAGSRRQEAQRLGRILRKKKSRAGTGLEDFDAFFYTLVSNDTREVYFTAKRQQFLIDQGYSYKVIPTLLESGGASDDDHLMLNERDDQINLLAAVLHASETEAANEVIEQTDAIEAHIKQTSSKRSIGSMSALSGAKGMTYMEYSTKKSTGKKPIGGGKLSKLRKLK